MDKVQDIKERLAEYRKGGEACLWNSDFDTLISEVERLQHESDVWEKLSLVAIATERDELRVENKRLREELEAANADFVLEVEPREHRTGIGKVVRKTSGLPTLTIVEED